MNNKGAEATAFFVVKILFPRKSRSEIILYFIFYIIFYFISKLIYIIILSIYYFYNGKTFIYYKFINIDKYCIAQTHLETTSTIVL